MVSFTSVLKEFEIKRFTNAYKKEVGDIEKVYMTSKKAYERSLQAFIKKNITHNTFKSLWAEAFDYTQESYILHTKPDNLDVLRDLIFLYKFEIEQDDFYLIKEII